MPTQAWAPLLLRLNCPWRAPTAAAMVRSTMLGPSASIGAVRLVVPTHATSSSAAAVPAWTPTTEQAGSLFVALRIKKNTLPNEKVFRFEGVNH